MVKNRIKKGCARIVAVWLSLLLALGVVPAASAAEPSAAQTERSLLHALYQDVPENAYYLKALEVLTLLGVIRPNEAGGFAPSAPVTRAEFAAWLARSLGLQPADGSALTDVPASLAEAPYIHALVQAGVVRGYEDGTFRGDRPITRAEAAMLAARITGQPDAPHDAARFADVREDHWFAGAVGTLANMRVIAGKANGNFAPGDVLTRGEAAVLLYRLLFEDKRIESLNGDTVTINGYD